MSENEARIEELVQTVPTIERTTWQKVLRVGAVVAAAVAFASLAIAIIGFLRTADLANCTNDNLGVRNGPNVADRIAADRLASADQMLGQSLAASSNAEAAALLALTSADRQVRVQAFHAIVAAQQASARAEQINVIAHNAYKRTRAADDRVRARNPIGKC